MEKSEGAAAVTSRSPGHISPHGICLLMLLALALAAPGVPARDVSNLYSAQVEVADRSPGELARGARAALAAVLVKLTGDRRAAAREGIGALLGKASKLMFKYAYAPLPEGPGLLLDAEFDEPAVSAELNALGVPLWGRQRPDTVAFIVIDEAGRRSVLGGDEPGLRGEALLTRAAQRGIPLLLPLMDIEETQHLAHAADWNGIATTALALASRYGTTGVLVGYLRESAPGLWESNWRMQIGAEATSWHDEGDIAALMLEGAADRLADTLASRYADPGLLGTAEAFAIDIEGLGSAADYARVVTYLDGLDAVTSLFVRGVEADRVHIEVSARGGRAGLAQTIAFGRVLTPLPLPDAYRLLP